VDGSVPPAPGSAHWRVLWTAPAEHRTVLLHVAGLAGDGDQSSEGDRTYTAELVAGGEPCGSAPAMVRDAGPERLQQRQAGFLAALAERDVERTVAHFADDAVLHIANMPAIQGRAAIERFYGNVFRFLAASDPVAERTRVSSGGDMAYTLGRVTNTFAGEQGPVEHTGKFTLVWEKRDGEWWVAVYGVSSDRPDAPR
jgi:ketosteroid isomerase-like protein